MSARLSVLFLFLAASVSAQPAPLVGSTARTTSTSATSLCVGGAAGCASATGGIKAGPIDVSLVTSAGAVGIANSVPADTTMKLYNNAGTLSWNGSPLSVGGSTVSGTIGKLAKFTGAAAVGDSICSESGTTITCVNTVSAATLTGALSTASQPNVTTMAGLVSVGTIGTGVWQGTLVGLTYGGTGANLSGTGGTSQFLRQNSSGAAVTVVRPAVSDLSDAANVALLNASNTFTNGTQVIDSTTNALLDLDRGTTAHFAGLTLLTAGATKFIVGIDDTASENFVIMEAGGAARWGVNAAGDWTFGASSNIADSSGTPTLGSGWKTSPTIAGTDYAFTVYVGTGGGSATAGDVNFGHTWTNAPVCVAGAFHEDSVPKPSLNAVAYASTTVVTINFDTTTSDNAYVKVICRSY